MPLNSNDHLRYTVRNYRPADFDSFVRFSIAAERREPSGRRVSPQAIAEHLRRPGYSPQQDLFLAETDGNTMVGYLKVTPEPAIGRVILDGRVHPEHRRKGLATKLLGQATRRARELGVKVLHVNIGQDDVVAKTVLVSLGFDCVRRFLELRRDMAQVSLPVTGGTVLACRPLRRGEEDKLAWIQNRAFAGSWGYNPNTAATITYHLNLGNGSPDDVILAFDGGRLVGYCWTLLADEGDAASDEKKGRVFMIGTDPDYQSGGVGRKILLAGLDRLKSKGVAVAGLTVDSQNEVALALYRSLGFEVETSSLWYEKLLP